MKKFIFTILFVTAFFYCYAENSNIEENQFKGAWVYLDEDNAECSGFIFNNNYVLVYEEYEKDVIEELWGIFPYFYDENFVIIHANDCGDEYKLYGFIQNSVLYIYDEYNDIIGSYIKAKPENEIFPKVLSCPDCYKQFKVTKSGRYKCSECTLTLIVNKQGKIILEDY
jgi:hypothetical protein